MDKKKVQMRTYDDVAKLIEFYPQIQCEESTFMDMIHQVDTAISDEQINEWRTVMHAVQVSFKTKECVQEILQFVGGE